MRAFFMNERFVMKITNRRNSFLYFSGMKKKISLLFLVISVVLFGFTHGSESPYNVDHGVMLDGIDVVSILSGKAEKGNSKFAKVVDGVTYYFLSKSNLEKFSVNESKYLPAFGGWCAYAMVEKPQKVEVDPDTYKIVNGRLLLFYNAWGINTLEKWNKWGDDAKYYALAQKNWEILKSKK